MKINPGSRVKLTLRDVTCTFNPTGSTIELGIDGTWYPATWLDSPTVVDGKWVQSAETTGWFAGPEAVANGATVLSVTPTDRHATEGRITSGGQTVVFPTAPLDVKD